MRQKNANDSGKEYTGYIRIIDCQNAKIVNKNIKTNIAEYIDRKSVV